MRIDQTQAPDCQDALCQGHNSLTVQQEPKEEAKVRKHVGVG